MSDWARGNPDRGERRDSVQFYGGEFGKLARTPFERSVIRGWWLPEWAWGLWIRFVFWRAMRAARVK